MQEEVWKDIPGFSGYQASNLGRIRSGDRIIEKFHPKRNKTTKAKLKGRLLRPFIKSIKRRTQKEPYDRQYIEMRADGSAKGKHYTLHRMVLLAFRGAPAVGEVGCHNDGNPMNNNLSNLRWGTLASNSQDVVKHGDFVHPSSIYPGCMAKGVDHGKAKLTEEAVKHIRSIPFYYGLYADLSRQYNLNKTTIIRAYTGKSWTHI